MKGEFTDMNNEDHGKKRREWVKNAIIIFLIIMLLLTFFSNTIMNYSLPEVSAKYVSSGTLSEQIRGSGTVEASQSYEVKIDETRKIASVDVKVGDEIKKGDTLYTLEDSESAELDTAREELKTEQSALDGLEIAYKKALLKIDADYSKDELAIANQEEDIKLAKEDLENLADYQEQYEKAKLVTKDCQSAVDDLNDQITALTSEDYASMGTSYYNQITTAKNNLEKAEKDKTASEEKVKEYESLISADGDQEKITALRKNIESKKLEISQAQMDYTMLDPGDEQTSELLKKIDTLELELKQLNDDYNTALSKSSVYDQNKLYLTSAKKGLSDNTQKYDSAKKKLDTILSDIKADLKGSLNTAESRLEEAKAKEEELSKKAGKTVEEAEKDIRDKERALETAKLDLEAKKRTDAQAAGESALDLQEQLDKIADQKDKIADCEEKIKKLEDKSIGAKITAQVGGKITSLALVAGEEAAQGSTVAVIEMSEKGYTLEMPVTVNQAKKVKIGDEAEIQYFWYGDASAVLRSITTDEKNPAKNKILKFEIKGDVTPGQNLQLAMGSKGQQYDVIVPNSAIREDNNGKFVLSVVAKSSPLGNRYIAERVDVEVLASDDTSSAVSGGLFGGEFIITASTKPVEPGNQVRLVDN